MKNRFTIIASVVLILVFIAIVGSTQTRLYNTIPGISGIIGTLYSANAVGATLNSGVTDYMDLYGVSGVRGAEGLTQVILPVPCTFQKMYVYTINTSQPATGSFVITLRKNGANSSLVVTIAANSAAGTYSDISDTVSANAGDLFNFQLVNNATSTSTQVQTIGVQCK